MCQGARAEVMVAVVTVHLSMSFRTPRTQEAIISEVEIIHLMHVLMMSLDFMAIKGGALIPLLQ
jgi:hypothetical protein